MRKNGILRECEEEVNGHNLEADPASNANRSTNKMTTRKRKKEELSIIEVCCSVLIFELCLLLAITICMVKFKDFSFS